ncbi:tetratricopeptide repeat protein [Candidatus Babeliales bacterium]|nr:tetratricopeptide repeat protein [Candidatus Babeliales bacterium]
MKIRTLLLALSCTAFIPSCGKKKKRNTAQEHYHNSIRAASTGNIELAITCIDKALVRDKRPQHLALKATLCYQNHDFDTSKKLFEQCLKDKTITVEYAADVSNNYACVLNQIGDRTSAERIWKSLTMNSHYSSPEVAWFNLGLRAWNDYIILKPTQHKQHAQAALKIAQQRFEKALLLEPNYIDALYCKAQAQIEMKQKAQAKKSLSNLLALTPNHSGARNLIAALK